MSDRAITVDVRLFAAPREAVDRSRLEVILPSDATVRQLLDHLVAQHPALGTYRAHLQVAVNRTIVAPDWVLHDADEVALLPPVGGG